MGEFDATKAQATKALAEVKTRFAGYWVEGCEPKLKENWDYNFNRAKWCIVWEDGPYDWAINFSFQVKSCYAEPYNGWALCLYKPWDNKTTTTAKEN